MIELLFWSAHGLAFGGCVGAAIGALVVNRRAARMVRLNKLTWTETEHSIRALEDAITRALLTFNQENYLAVADAMRQAHAVIERTGRRYRGEAE